MTPRSGPTLVMIEARGDDVVEVTKSMEVARTEAVSVEITDCYFERSMLDLMWLDHYSGEVTKMILRGLRLREREVGREQLEHLVLGLSGEVEIGQCSICGGLNVVRHGSPDHRVTSEPEKLVACIMNS